MPTFPIEKGDPVFLRQADDRLIPAWFQEWIIPNDFDLPIYALVLTTALALETWKADVMTPVTDMQVDEWRRLAP